MACGVFFALAALALVPGCRVAQSPPSEETPVTARIGVPEADVSGSDNGLTQVAGFLANEGLTTQNTDGRVRPRLAESWMSSGDGLTWRFLLRKGITFHDGTAATAPLIAEALRGAIARASQRRRPGLADIVGIEPIGATEIDIKLRRRSTFLLDDLDQNITRTLPDRSVVGTGAFKTISQTPDEIVLEAHEAYHQGRPHIRQVIVRAYPTLRTAWASMLRSEIDVLWDLSRDVVEFSGSSEVALYSYLRHYVHLIAFNSARPNFGPTAVRRALNGAIDRERLIRDVLRGQGVAASGPIWPLHWAFDSSLRGYVYDPSLAGATLDAAGVRLTAVGGRRARFSFTCILPMNRGILERIALNVQKQLYDIGVDMQLQPVSAEEYDRRIRASDFDAILIEMLSGPYLSRPYQFWRSDGEPTGYNVFGYKSAAADRWFDALRSAATDAEYRSAASQLQRALLEDPPALFLAWSQRTRAITRRFNVPVEPDRDPMPNFWRWTVNDGSRATH